MNSPKLTIKVEHPKIILELRDAKGKLIDSVQWQEQNNLSTTLLDSIDKLLRKNKIEIEELKKIDVETSQARYTSARISKAVAKTVNWYLGA